MPSPRPTKVAFHVKTDVGMVREHNEDTAYADPEGTFFVVADGMGGHAAGEVASAMAVAEVTSALDTARPLVQTFISHRGEDERQELVHALEEAVRRAHRAVFERGGRETDKKGMGTTIDVLLIADGEAFVAHVGDSRTYLVRDGAAAQVTTDHTVAEVLVIEGKLSVEEARQSPLRTILVNAIGVAPDVGVEMAHVKLRLGDKLLLCSDGLHDYFPAESELAEVLSHTGVESGLARLVDLAKERGGHDNITGLVVDVVEGSTAEDMLVPAEDPNKPKPTTEEIPQGEATAELAVAGDAADVVDEARATTAEMRAVELPPELDPHYSVAPDEPRATATELSAATAAAEKALAALAANVVAPESPAAATDSLPKPSDKPR